MKNEMYISKTLDTERIVLFTGKARLVWMREKCRFRIWSSLYKLCDLKSSIQTGINSISYFQLLDLEF